MKAVIRSLGSYAPIRVMPNDELAHQVDTSDEWIYSHTGIRNRHIAASDQAASDLAIEASLNAIEATKHDGGPALEANDIDLILLATATPDYIGFPSTACIVQAAIGANKAAAMDISAACTGFIYAIEVARSFIIAKSARTVLVIGSEVFSKIVNWKDRSTCVLFGDGAGAALVCAAEDNSSLAWEQGHLGIGYLASDGTGAEHLIRPAGGSKQALIPGVTSEEDQFVKMNGRQVYLFAITAIIDSVNKLLESNKLTFEEIDLVVPHQANRRIIEASCKRAGWDESKFFMNMEEYANTSAASIPLAMDELYRAGKIKRGQKIITLGFGGGLTFGGNFLVW